MIKKKRIIAVFSLFFAMQSVCSDYVVTTRYIESEDGEFDVLNVGQKIYDFELSRVSFPSQEKISDEQNAQWYANIKRNVALTASAVGFCCMMYATIKACGYFSGLDAAKKQQAEDHMLLRLLMEQNKITIPNAAAVVSPTVPSLISSDGWFSWNGISQGVSSFATGCGSIIAQGSPTVLAGIVLNKVNNVFTNAVQSGSVEQNVQWYVQNQTKLGHVVKDLELYTVGYDIESPLLDLDNLQQDTNIHIKQFIQEIANRAKERQQDNFLGEDYFKYLFDEVKKKHMKKGGELERLQDLAVGALVYEDSPGRDSELDLFNRDKAHRQDIADLCQILVQEVQKISTFVLAHFDKNQPVMAGCAGHEQKLMDLVSTTNAYLDMMETLLNVDAETLEDLSCDGKGMFTCTYEFVKVLKQQIEHIHQYCSITG